MATYHFCFRWEGVGWNGVLCMSAYRTMILTFDGF